MDLIIRRFAFVIALLCGGAMTQLPEYAAQYQQRLGGAIDELAAIVARFDAESQAQGMTEQGGIDRLRANPDTFVQQRGTQMSDIAARLTKLRDLRDQLRTSSSAQRLTMLATHFDMPLASRTFENFQPAVPITTEALILGLIGFITGGGAIHAAHYTLRRKKGRRPRHTAGEIA